MRSTGMLAALWLVAAVAATVIGFAAVGLVGGDLGGNEALAQPPLVQVPVPASTSNPTPTPSGSPSTAATPSGTPSAGPAAVQRTRPTTGGVVTARCTGPTAWLVSWSPNPGWAVDEIERGPAREAEVRFESSSGRVEVTVGCAGGVPAFSVEGPTSGGGDNGDDRDGDAGGSGGSGSNSGSGSSGSGSGGSGRD